MAPSPKKSTSTQTPSKSSPSKGRTTVGTANRKSSKANQGNLCVKLYLALFNSISFAGWAYYAYELIRTWSIVHFSTTLPALSFVPLPQILNVLRLVQSLALFEILHVVIGFVPGSIIMTAIQVFSRLFIVWVPLFFVPIAAHPVGVAGFWFISFAWTLTELIRYPFYALNLFNACPCILTWLRYTLFLILYPMGVLGEMGIVHGASLIYIGWPQPWMQWIPNILISVYPVGLFFLYSYMLRQRSKILSCTTVPKIKRS